MDKGKPYLDGGYVLMAHTLGSGRKVFYKWESGGKKIGVTWPRWQLVNFKPRMTPRILLIVIDFPTKLVENTFKNMSQRYFYLYLISHVLGEPSMITELEYYVISRNYFKKIPVILGAGAPPFSRLSPFCLLLATVNLDLPS